MSASNAFPVGKNGVPAFPFDVIEKNPTLVDNAILPLLRRVNNDYHIRTASSCSGHPIENKAPLLSLYIPPAEGIYFYSVMYDTAGKSEKVMEIPFSLPTYVQWEQFTYQNHIIKIPSISSYTRWKRLPFFEVLMYGQQCPTTDDEAEECLRNFSAVVIDLLDRFLEYRKRHKMCKLFYR